MDNKKLELFEDKLREMFGFSKGVAKKMAFELMKKSLVQTEDFSKSLLEFKKDFQECSKCHNFDSSPVCSICTQRSNSRHIMIVEKAMDIQSFEKLDFFKGKYYVLTEILSPKKQNFSQKFIDQLLKYCKNALDITLALGTTINGQITSQRLKVILEPLKTQIYQLSTGIPYGASIDIVDPITLKQSLENKIKM